MPSLPEAVMKLAQGFLLIAAFALAAPTHAAFHLFRIDQVYSNADGTVQYVVMRETTGSNGEGFWKDNNAFLAATSAGGGTQTFPFPANLPSQQTASRKVLIATQSFAALGFVTPDYTIPNGFIPRGGGSLNYANVDAIPLPALPTDGATAIDRNGTHVAATPTNFAGASTTLAATPPPAAALDLDQHGLTGSWFKAAESGQGIEVEFYPDLVGLGTALVSGAWFTFDAAAGGADRQRWYVFNGNAARGATSIPIAIGQNVGGNFAAPPQTTAAIVGSGTLAFSDCGNGVLHYTFNDGRNGTIPITRITPNVTCVMSGAAPTNADFALSGNWYDPATSGQGFVFEVNPLPPPQLFFAWYTYSPTGQQTGGGASQRWYTGQGAFTPGSRTIALTLGETTGGVFDQAAPVSSTVAVGSATVAFTNCTTAQLAFNFTGGSSAGRAGTINLVRVGPVPPGCTATTSASTDPPPGMGYPPGGYGPP